MRDWAWFLFQNKMVQLDENGLIKLQSLLDFENNQFLPIDSIAQRFKLD